MLRLALWSTMKLKRTVFLWVLAWGLVLAGVFSVLERPRPSSSRKLKVFTYSSFQGTQGPGPVLKKLFESQCQCEVALIRAGSANLILQRMKLVQEAVDVVVGLDQFSLKPAQKDFSWNPVDVSSVNWVSDVGALGSRLQFVPYNFSPLTFIYRKSQVPHPPKNFQELMRPEFKKKISLQDPRQSTPGLHFLLWTVQQTNSLSYYEKLKQNISRISSSWSSSYGLFMQKKARMVFSHLTSLVYHWKNRQETDVQALSFTERHPVHIEYMAVSSRCQECELAEQFVQFLLTPEAQKV